MPFGIYIHWPFCKSKCPYCDFNSHVAEQIDHTAWRDSYLRALDSWAEKTQGRSVSTVFFGGGTPSLMAPETVAAILDRIGKNWKLEEGAEITLEANPTSFELSKFEGFRRAGINRVSIGVQSLRSADLVFLGREHNPGQAIEAMTQAKKLFDRVTFDLIYARPSQTLAAWREELREALDLAAGHLSLYQLTIETGTPFYTRHARGEFTVPEQDLAADFYDLTQEIMEDAGMPAYEVSNHAAPGQESRHNLIYWRYEDYLGIGPGAHGRVTMNGDNKYATRDHRAPAIWLDRVRDQGHGADPSEPLSTESQFQEALMMGLRLREGVPYARLEALGDYIDYDSIIHLKKAGMIADDKKSLRTTPQGFKCLNAVTGYLLGHSRSS